MTQTISAVESVSASSSRPLKIWIDLDNTPHIPFFRPIIRELQKRAYSVLLTARDAYQVCAIAEKYGLHPQTIGRHYGKSLVRKFVGFLYRAAQLAPLAIRERPDLALNHGSRSQALVCNLLRIPTVTIMDYEHTREFPFAYPKWMIVPNSYPEKVLEVRPNRVRRYPGLKEDVYAPDFVPDPSILDALGLPQNQVVVTVRPPASDAHYHVPSGDRLFEAFMDRVCATDGVTAVLLPRHQQQERELRSNHPAWFKNSKVIIPGGIVDGLNLIWHSDLVVSGGGTMNREAAALGVPVYSIFGGRTGSVDRGLQEEGRMILIESVQQVQDKILLQRRPRESATFAPRLALSQIIAHVEEILSIQAKA